MSFVRRHQYLLLFLGVLVFSSVMVVRQYMANQSAHIERREDFIVLHQHGMTKPCEHLYDALIGELPQLTDRELAEDLQRTSLIVDPKTPNLDSLLWKYYVSVQKELEGRAEQRVNRALQREGK